MCAWWLGAYNQRERERDNISNRLQIGNKCTRSVWIFSLPKLPMIGMQESYYYIYIVYMYVPTKTKTHNSTFSSLKNQLHERDRKNVLCNIGTVHFKARQIQLAKMNILISVIQIRIDQGLTVKIRCLMRS